LIIYRAKRIQKIARFIFVAAPAAKILKRDISSALEKIFLGIIGDFFGC